MSTDNTPRPQGLYVPATLSDNMIRTAGMTPRRDGVLVVTGRVGGDIGLDEARRAAAIAVGNAVQAVLSVLPENTAFRCVEMTVYIACAADFTDLSAVADGATAVLAASYGAEHLPARSAIGVYALPGGAPVEIALTAQVISDPVPGSASPSR